MALQEEILSHTLLWCGRVDLLGDGQRIVISGPLALTSLSHYPAIIIHKEGRDGMGSFKVGSRGAGEGGGTLFHQLFYA